MSDGTAAEQIKLTRMVEEARREAERTCRRWSPEEIEASPYVDPAYQARLFERGKQTSGEFTVAGLFFSL